MGKKRFPWDSGREVSIAGQCPGLCPLREGSLVSTVCGGGLVRRPHLQLPATSFCPSPSGCEDLPGLDSGGAGEGQSQFQALCSVPPGSPTMRSFPAGPPWLSWVSATTQACPGPPCTLAAKLLAWAPPQPPSLPTLPHPPNPSHTQPSNPEPPDYAPGPTTVPPTPDP